MRRFLIIQYLCLSFPFLAITACAQGPDAPIILDAAAAPGCQPTPEICGDGVDQNCDGGDTLCPGTDKDRDGFPESQDCDDTNRLIYPGISTTCSATCGQGTQTCQSSGTSSTCSCTPLCEALSGGTCYYVSALTGNDSSAGTFAAPLKTLLRFGFHTPAGFSKINLSPGDVVYVMGGLYDHTVDAVGQKFALYLRNFSGTAAAPITIKAYPGASPVISPKNNLPGITIQAVSHLRIEGLTVAQAFWRGIAVTGVSSFVEIRNVRVQDTHGEDKDNLSGIYLSSSSNVNVHHSYIHDNYDRQNQDTGGEKTGNSRNVVIFGGNNNRFHHNVIFQSPAITAAKTGGCLTYKHANVGTGTFEADHNILWNCAFHALGGGMANGKFHHNLVLNSEYAFSFKDNGGPCTLRDNVVEHNTVSGGRFLEFNASDGCGTIGQHTFRKNITFDTSSPYNADRGGAVSVHPYGSTTRYQHVVGGGKLRFENNCYFNPSRSMVFGLYASNSRPEWALGGLYSFTKWKGFGYDTNSLVADPLLNGDYNPGNAQCQDKGVYVGW